MSSSLLEEAARGLGSFSKLEGYSVHHLGECGCWKSLRTADLLASIYNFILQVRIWVCILKDEQNGRVCSKPTIQ